jgi:hypothetical protein
MECEPVGTMLLAVPVVVTTTAAGVASHCKAGEEDHRDDEDDAGDDRYPQRNHCESAGPLPDERRVRRFGRGD